jgi:tetratricopeptide (TPR) repeat protein
MGLAYTMLNEKVNFEEVIKAYKKAIEINPDKDEADFSSIENIALSSCKISFFCFFKILIFFALSIVLLPNTNTPFWAKIRLRRISPRR